MREDEPTEFALLQDNDPAAVVIHNGQGRSPYIFTCEHAGRAIPTRLGDLGIGASDRERHIAWDIGAAATARRIAEAVDAPLVLQQYSRLVIDCNRPADSQESIPLVSDGTSIPGNDAIHRAEREARHLEVHRPFHQAVETLLDERMARRAHPILIAFHTFTPALAVNPAPRPWDMGLLYNRDDRLARLFDGVLCEMEHGFSVAHNEPYSVCDETDYTLPVHGESRGICNLLLEVRNDHVSDEHGIAKWSEFLGAVLRAVEEKV